MQEEIKQNQEKQTSADPGFENDAIKPKTRGKKRRGTIIKEVSDPIWLSLSEGSNLGSVNKKTIRRGIQSQEIKYKIIKERYFVELSSLVQYLYSKKKLKNKFLSSGLGQYVKEWRK